MFVCRAPTVNEGFSGGTEPEGSAHFALASALALPTALRSALALAMLRCVAARATPLARKSATRA
eukprot:2041696-Prymnesium_polylepis.1